MRHAARALLSDSCCLADCTVRGWPPGMVRTAILLGLALLCGADEEDELATENEMLKKRLEALESRMRDEQQYTYLVAKGYISGAENVYMETMEVAEAKQWCNANVECKGFTFLAPAEGESQPEDEVTVTFKGAPEAGHSLKVDADPAMISYIKETAALPAIGDAAMQLSGAGGQAVLAQGAMYEAICLLLAVSGTIAFGYRYTSRRRRSALLPVPLGVVQPG